jgi:hypothetical protein
MEKGKKAILRAALTAASVGLLVEFWHLGIVIFLLVGVPISLVALGVAGGARPPWKIPAKDIFLYLAISIALVLGIVAYAEYTSRITK